MTTQRARARRRRFSASTPTQKIRLTKRDATILEALDRYRFLSSEQIILVAGGSPQKILRRLRQLFDHGFVDRPRAQIASIVFGNRSMIYGLGDRGVRHLRGAGVKTRRREQNNACTNYFINHAVETADFFIHVERSVFDQSKVKLWHQDEILDDPKNDLSKPTWPVRFSWPGGGLIKVNVTPDGIFGLEDANGRTAFFFVEIDRGTEPIMRSSPRQSSILKKMLAYKATHDDKACGLPNFRVLIVTTSAKRIDAMIDAIPEGASAGLFLFATTNGANERGLKKCWVSKSGNNVSLFD